MLTIGNSIELIEIMADQCDEVCGSKGSIVPISDFVGKNGLIIGINKSQYPYDTKFVKNNEVFIISLNDCEVEKTT